MFCLRTESGEPVRICASHLPRLFLKMHGGAEFTAVHVPDSYAANVEQYNSNKFPVRWKINKPQSDGISNIFG